MTKEELAAVLDGRDYRSEITESERETARKNGLVVVFGYSDDIMALEGAIRDEFSCYGGGTAYLNESGLWVNECDETCPYAEMEAAKCKTIEAVWDEDEEDIPWWSYETDIPHSKFNIYVDGAVWCVGIVFEMASLKR